MKISLHKIISFFSNCKYHLFIKLVQAILDTILLKLICFQKRIWWCVYYELSSL